jgi:hypothetical protein
MRTMHPSPAEPSAPDPHRAGSGGTARHPLPDPLIRLLAQLILLLLQLFGTARDRRARRRAWCHLRPDLEAGSAQHCAAAIRGAFGNSIAWMCLYNGIGPGHRNWPELSRAILAFGGSLRAFRPGRKAMGVPWWENPYVMPGLTPEQRATPAADMLIARLAQHSVADAPAPARPDEAAPLHALARSSWRKLRTRVVATGPPTGPPQSWDSTYCYA